MGPMFGINIVKCKPSPPPRPLTGYWVERLTGRPDRRHIEVHTFNEAGGHMVTHLTKTPDLDGSFPWEAE